MPTDEMTVNALPTDVPTEAVAVPIRPLLVSGLVVSKAALIDVLRGFVPELTDIVPLGEDRFELSIGPSAPTMGVPR